MKKRAFMNMKLFISIFFIVFMTGLPCIAEEEDQKEQVKIMDEMVITGTRTETPLSESTKSIEVVDPADLDEQQQYFLPDLLDNEPGVIVNRSGGLGQYSTISIRGAGTQHTQFQYNGMPMRDIADSQGALQYFIEDMFSGTNLDHVEVLKGNNSTLYGTQAMGGVINIIPRKWEEGLSARLRGEVGPNNTYIANGSVNYGKESYYIDVNPLYIDTDGESYGGPNSYYYENTGLTFGSGVKPSDRTSLELNAIAYDSELALGDSPSLDASGNVIKQQASDEEHREGLLYQLGLNWDHSLSSLWNYSIKGSYTQTERHYFWSETQGNQSNYDGEMCYIETQHNLDVYDWMTLTLGADYEKDVYDGQEPRDPASGDYSPVNFDKEWNFWDAFSQAKFNLMDQSLFFTFGGRYNDHEKFDEKAVWEASGAYLFKSSKTKVHAHVGTGYRTPSLYEIYGGYLYNGSLITIGNPDLKPEESTGYEFGVDQVMAGGMLVFGATYFFTEFEDLIIFDNSIFGYNNASEAETSGVEAYITLKPWRFCKLDLAYTHTDSKYKENDGSDWTKKEYLPDNKLNLVATLYPTEKLTISFDIGWEDEEIVPLYDPSSIEVRWEEDSVTTVDLAVTYKALDFLDVFARADNLSDEDYTEGGYQMPGRSVYAGINLSF